MVSDNLQRRILAAGKKIPAETVIKNGKVVNVFTREIMEVDVAIVDGIIVGLGTYTGTEIIDAQGKYIVPGLIDGHVHIESSLLPPHEFAKISLLHGVTSVMTDPHEIGNIAGIQGIRFMLDSARQAPLNIFVMLPACVPVTTFETNGATLNAVELETLINEPEVLGLAEVMNFKAVQEAESTILDKLELMHQQNALIDGHAAGISGEDLNVYLSAKIRTDHEAVNQQEALDRLKLGMYLMVREGTVAKDLHALMPVINEKNSRRCLFVTDDKLINDLLAEGSIDHEIRLAAQVDFDPLLAIQMATLNAAECFKQTDIGAVAPGYQADLFFTDDLKKLPIHDVFKNGKQVVQNGRLVETAFPKVDLNQQLQTLPRMNVAEFSTASFELPLKTNQAKVIEIIPNSLITKQLNTEVMVKDGLFIPDTTTDHLKIAVLERHQKTGYIGLGIVKGFELKVGALATSVSHDSHNIVVVGTNDEDMDKAAKLLIEHGGGMVVVNDLTADAFLPLSIGGIMADLSYSETNDALNQLLYAARKNGVSEAFDPFLTLSFLTLPVIPELKITDRGLFAFSAFNTVAVDE